MVTNFVFAIFRVYYFLIFIRIILSWVNVRQYSEWANIIKKLTDPYLDLFKKIIPPIGMVDISPIAALFALNIIQNVIIALLAKVNV